MSTLTIRQVDEDVKRRLQIRAAENGRSMEAEIRAILADVVESDSRSAPSGSLGEAMAEFRRRTGGIELDLPSRSDDIERPVPDFS